MNKNTENLIIVAVMSVVCFIAGYIVHGEVSDANWKYSGVLPGGKNLSVSLYEAGELVPSTDGKNLVAKQVFVIRWPGGFTLIPLENTSGEWKERLLKAANTGESIKL